MIFFLMMPFFPRIRWTLVGRNPLEKSATAYKNHSPPLPSLSPSLPSSPLPTGPPILWYHVEFISTIYVRFSNHFRDRSS